MSLLEVEALSVRYDKAIAVEDVCITVDPDEIVCVLGPNGAGKTSILKAISRVQSSHGLVKFGGRQIDCLGAHEVVKLGLSHCPEGRHLFSDLSVKKNLILGAFIHDDRVEIEKDLEWVFQLFPVLNQRAAQRVSTLSGGEQQMVAIARAIMSRPRLLMLDEPSVGIAMQLKSKIFESLVEIATKRTAILLVEQDAASALEISGRAYVLEGGRVVNSGLASELSKDDHIRRSYLGI